MAHLVSKLKSQIKLSVETVTTEEDGYFVVYCPALELSGYAETVEKAKASFEKEMEIFLEETCKRGTLEKYLLKNGWCLQQSPKLSYLPPPQSYKKISSLKKRNGKVSRREINIPVYC